MERIISVKSLKDVIRESTSEFKPKLGNDVEKDNKKNNKDSYSDNEKRMKDYQKDMKSQMKKPDKSAAGGENRGMDSIIYDSVDDKFQKRTVSQMKGYADDEAEKKHKNDEFGNAEFNTDEDVKARKEKVEKVVDDKTEMKTSGLVGRLSDKKEVKKGMKTMYKENIKRLRFKHTWFLGENDMKRYIPDEFKCEGKKFYMVDNHDNEYLVEWNQGCPEILNHTNKRVISEELSKIEHLMNYNSSNYFTKTTNDIRENADKNLTDIMNKTRNF
jgi:hypothetical protein